MEILLLLIGFSLLIGIGFLTAFIWSVRHGQFEDVKTPGYRVLFEDTHSKENTNTQSEHK